MITQANCDIHNRFDIVVRNAETGEIEQRGQAKNIVLDRIYTRLCSFNTYFDQIVFGSGTGTPTEGRSTLFNRIASKPAQNEELIRAFPLSTWTRKIRLETTEYNGQTLTEVGISDMTTNINTHAMIQDAEGNPISLEKTELRIIDIYATVFITLQDVDEGLRFTGDGLRNYLTGATMASDQIGLIYEGLQTNLSSARTANPSEKSVKTAVTFNVQHHNFDVKSVTWVSTGITWDLPRAGVFEGWDVTGETLGVGGGERVSFGFPTTKVKNVTAYINGIQNDDWELDMFYNVVFNTPVPQDSVVTADYTCAYQPKDINHILKVTAELKYNVTQPSPLAPIPIPDAGTTFAIPGRTVPLAGDSTYGFYGEVPASQLLDGFKLCNILGLTTGTPQHSFEPWLKFALDGRILFVAKKTIRYGIPWSTIDAVGAVYGKEILNQNVKVRLLSTEEWDALMYPIHADHPGGAPNWANYTDEDLLVHRDFGIGTYSWISNSPTLARGYMGVHHTSTGSPSGVNSAPGFRPVIEIIKE